MKISIITPSWNQGRFFRRCLESIRVTPGVAVEHIVLDNCSTDNTRDLLAEFAARDDGVERHFIIEKDDGQTRAINDGLRMATGDVVCWLNTDEWYAEDTLTKVTQHFIASPTTDFLYGNCTFVDSGGNVLKVRRSLPFNPSMLLYYGCYISSASAFVRRRVVDEGHLLDPNFRVAMDYEWYVRLATLGYKFAHIPDALAFFTWHQNNISMVHKDRSFEERLLIQRTFGKLPLPDVMRPVSARLLRKFWKGCRGIQALLTSLPNDGHGPREAAFTSG